MFLDDVGVTIAMITVTLLAVCVVLLKVLIFSDKVSHFLRILNATCLVNVPHCSFFWHFRLILMCPHLRL